MPTTTRRRFTINISTETALLATSIFWAATVNRQFFAGALQGHRGAGFAACLFAALVALHFLLLAPWATRQTTKPLLALMLVATAVASAFMAHFGVYLDPAMLQNTVGTDARETRELLAWGLLPHLLLLGALPVALLSRVRLASRGGWLRATAVRLASMLAALVVLVGAVLAVYQPLASLMRNQTQLRYLITPGNYVWSLASVAGIGARDATGPKLPIGLDAAPGPGWAARRKPLVVVVVVGETARAANWGLNGYARQTTPGLAALPVVNFTDVGSCGTDTETSLPCMFAPVGRRDYDQKTIRGSEGLLQLLARAGVGVRWRDNQSGCKGVCDGVPTETVAGLNPPGLCADGRCFDEGLLHGIDGWLQQAAAAAPAAAPQLLLLHQLGNHGPAYFRRYPPAFARHAPACNDDDLQRCSQAEIVNAYDNALLYTDHVLTTLIRRLQAHAADVDSALLYVSDHGESLGENNIYLHGLPYAIAPAVQKHVPMVMWLSAGAERAAGIDSACLRRRATQPASHDNLFHTLLGLLDVRTALYEPALDLTAACRAAAR